MSDPKREFLDFTTDCFGDNVEMKVCVRDILARQLVDEGEMFEVANANLRKTANHPRRLKFFILSLIVLLGICCVVLLGYRLYQNIEIDDDFEISLVWPDDEYEDWEFYVGDLNERDKLLLFGDINKEDPVERAEGLWLVEADNPAAYIEYLLVYYNYKGGYPSDMLKTAEEIDSGNAVYYFFEAASLAEKSVKFVPGAVAGKGHFIVKDTEKFEQAMGLLKKAVDQPRYELYRKDMAKRRVPLLKTKGLDLMTVHLPPFYMVNKLNVVYDLRFISNMINAEAFRCEQERDTEGLKQLFQNWQKIYRRYYNSCESLIDITLLHLSLIQTCQALEVAAHACSLPNVEKKHRDFQLDLKKIAARSYGNSARLATKAWRKEVEEKGSMGSSEWLMRIEPKTLEENGVSIEDVEQERLAEHALWNRLVSLCLWLLMLVVALITWVYKSCSNRLAKGLAKRMLGVLGLRDWGVIVLVGVFFPIAYYWLINGVRSPVSVQNWNIEYRKMSLLIGQSICLLLLLILTPMLVANHQLGKYVPFREREKTWPLWGSFIITLIVMPVFGLVPLWSSHDHHAVKLNYCILSVGVMLMFFAPVFGYIIRQRSGQFGIMHHVRHHVLVPIYIFASLMMVLQVPIYHSIEKYWVEEYPFNKVDGSRGGLTWYENLLVDKALKELGDALDRYESE